MSAIITLVGAVGVIALIALGLILLWRTRRDIRRLERELAATRQELEIQRIVVNKGGDKPRHLRLVKVIAPLALLLGWIRDHPWPATAAITTAAAVVTLVVAGTAGESRRPGAADPHRPVEPPITRQPPTSTGPTIPPPSITAPGPSSATTTRSPTTAPTDPRRPTRAPTTTASSPAPPTSAPTTTPTGESPTSVPPTSSAPPDTGPPADKPACLRVYLEVLDIWLCVPQRLRTLALFS